MNGIISRYRDRGLRNVIKYSFLRFHSVRTGVSACKALARGRRYPSTAGESEILAGYDPDEITQQIRTHAYFGGISLPADTVKTIQAFANETPCHTLIEGRTVSFLPHEHGSMEKKLGKPIVLADYRASDCEAIQNLQKDPGIAEIARRYFGYRHGRIFTRLHWSFVCDATPEKRRQAKQTIDFHYDLHASHFIYFNFYLTDVDETAGPHVLVQGSHGRKTLGSTVWSANRSDAFIAKAYGDSNITTICGPAGYGFVEDHFCYHKATIPTKKNRLMMMVHVS